MVGYVVAVERQLFAVSAVKLPCRSLPEAATRPKVS